MAQSYLKAVDKTDHIVDADDMERFKRWYRRDVEKANKWRGGTKDNGGALEDYKFRDGDQWSKVDREWLEDQDRPAVQFNRTGVLVDAVVGIEVGNRREVSYLPRDINDSKKNELLTSAAMWFRDLCDAEDEESEAFKDAVTAGMGWTDTWLDRSENPDGEPKIDRIDPFEMVWDHNATKANLVDSKRRWRVRKIPIEQAIEMFPGIDPDDLNGAWADNDSEETEPHSNDPARRYTNEVEGPDNLNREVTVVQLQFKEKEAYYKVLLLTPEGQPQMVDLDEAKFKIAQKAGAVLQSAKLSRETVKQVFLGRVVLKKPMPTQTGMFTFNCITGLKDEDKGIFYGIVRRVKDPQRWANKWLTQILHILNSQSKGGLIAERSITDDIRQFEASYAKTEVVTWVKPGAIAGEKWAPKPMAQFPAGFDRLMQYADEMIIKASGISMELLGIAGRDQPGVLEYQRKQAGMGILAGFFDSMRRYRKIQGRGMLHLIQNQLADGRLVRIVGDEEAQYVPLMKEGIADVEYDIVVDDAPTSPNDKEKNWQIIQAMLPFFKEQLGPAQGLVIAKYSPLPQSFVEDLKKSMEQQQAAPPDPMQQAAVDLEKQKLALEADKILLETGKIIAEREKVAAELRKIEADERIARDEQTTERQRLGVEQTQAMADMEEAQQPEKEARSANDNKMTEVMQGLVAAMQLLQAPKIKEIVRDPVTGRASGMIERPMV